MPIHQIVATKNRRDKKTRVSGGHIPSPIVYPAGKYIVLYDYAGDGRTGFTFRFNAIMNAGESAPGRIVLDVATPSSSGFELAITNPDPDATGTDYIKNVRVCHEDNEAALLAGGIFTPRFISQIKPFKRLRFVEWQGINPANAYYASASWSGGILTFTISTALSFLVGRKIVTDGFTPEGYNVAGTITAVTATTVSVAAPDPGGPVTVQGRIAHDQPENGYWASRRTITSAFWGSESGYPTQGAPVEAMVALLNETGADGHFCIPHQADDDYITQFATYVRNNLNPGQKAYFEFSNEVWNTIYPQQVWAVRQAKLMWPERIGIDDPSTLNRHWYGVRSAQMSDIVKGVFASRPEDVKCIFAIQAGNVGPSQTALNCSLWSEGPCYTHGFDYLAGATYFGLGSVPASWITEWDTDDSGKNSALHKLFVEIEQGGLDPAGKPGGYVAESIDVYLGNVVSLANSFGLIPFAYECGQHLDGASASTDAMFNEANRDPRMGRVLARYFELHEAAGIPTENANFYKDFGVYGTSGSWGAAESWMQNTTPKLDAVRQRAHKAGLGMNLAGVTYYSNQQPFLDIMKCSEKWFTMDGSNNYTNETHLMTDLDDNGWPRSFAGMVTGTKVALLLMRTQPQVQI